MESHGDADRLILQRPEDIDLKRLDAIIAGGGVGEDAVRMLARNDLLGPGRFGKMFPDLEAFRPPDETLENLGLEMREPAPRDPALNNLEIPAGFTYLGQFIDHDLTFDQTAGFPEIDDPDEIAQARTPSLDLDSLYGTGPRRQPELYDRSTPLSRAAFRIGLTSPIPSSGGSASPTCRCHCPTTCLAGRTRWRSSPTPATTRTSSSRRPTWRS